MVRHQLSPQKPLGSRLCFSRTGVKRSPGSKRSSCPPPSTNLVRTRPIKRYQALPGDNVPNLSRAATPPVGHQIGARKRCAPGGTILSQPSRRRYSTDRLNREGSQWPHFSRVSLALHPPERHSLTHTPKPGFGGRGAYYDSG